MKATLKPPTGAWSNRPVFGIRADGKVVQLGFPSASLAEAVAKDLFAQGHARVEIVNHTSGMVMMVLRPEAADLSAPRAET